jgi:hypothetical protein
MSRAPIFTWSLEIVHNVDLAAAIAKGRSPVRGALTNHVTDLEQSTIVELADSPKYTSLQVLKGCID